MPTGTTGVSVRVRQTSHVCELQEFVAQTSDNLDALMDGHRFVAVTANCVEGAVALSIHVAPTQRAKAALIGQAFNDFIKNRN